MVLLAFLKLTFLLFLHLSIFFYTHPPFKTYHWIWRPWRGKKVKMIFYASMDFVWKSDYDCYYHYDYHIIAHTNNNQLVIPFNTWIPPSSHPPPPIASISHLFISEKKTKTKCNKVFSLIFVYTETAGECLLFFFQGKKCINWMQVEVELKSLHLKIIPASSAVRHSFLQHFLVI